MPYRWALIHPECSAPLHIQRGEKTHRRITWTWRGEQKMCINSSFSWQSREEMLVGKNLWYRGRKSLHRPRQNNFESTVKTQIARKQERQWRTDQVWGIVLGHAASNWGNYTLNQQLPTYLANVLRFGNWTTNSLQIVKVSFRFSLSFNGLLASFCYLVTSHSSFCSDIIFRHSLMRSCQFGFFRSKALCVCLQPRWRIGSEQEALCRP